MLILTKCSQTQAKKIIFLFFTLAALFFISNIFLVQGEIVDFNGETSPEGPADEADLSPQDSAYDKEDGREFLEQMKEKLKKSPGIAKADESKDISKISLQKGEGLLTKCTYRVGEKACGKCYCLKANPPSRIVFNGRKLRGCARLDISLAGDLDALVGRVVYYEGTADFNSNFICPRHFKLFTVRPAEEKPEDSQPEFKAK